GTAGPSRARRAVGCPVGSGRGRSARPAGGRPGWRSSAASRAITVPIRPVGQNVRGTGSTGPVLTTVCRMPVPLEVHDSPTAVGLRAAEVIARGIAAAAAEGRRYVLGCPSGRSPLPTYAELARLVAERGLDLRPVIIALMDEYVSRTGDGFAPVDDRLPHSCVGFARRCILAPLNAAAAPGRGVGEHGLRHPDPAAAPGEYDRE